MTEIQIHVRPGVLKLYGCISDGLLSEAIHLREPLHSVDLSGCSGFTASGLELITEAHPDIRNFDLSNCRGLSLDHVGVIARCRSLINLNVSGTGLANADVVALINRQNKN